MYQLVMFDVNEYNLIAYTPFDNFQSYLMGSRFLSCPVFFIYFSIRLNHDCTEIERATFLNISLIFYELSYQGDK